MVLPNYQFYFNSVGIVYEVKKHAHIVNMQQAQVCPLGTFMPFGVYVWLSRGGAGVWSLEVALSALTWHDQTPLIWSSPLTQTPSLPPSLFSLHTHRQGCRLGVQWLYTHRGGSCETDCCVWYLIFTTWCYLHAIKWVMGAALTDTICLICLSNTANNHRVSLCTKLK